MRPEGPDVVEVAMDTVTSLDVSAVERRLDAIVERLDQLAEDLKANSERTEVSAKFITEIHGTWKTDVESVKATKAKTHLSAGDRVGYGPRTGTVQWVSIDHDGNVHASVTWDDGETTEGFAFLFTRIVTPDI
jgi:hypothetical protein